ncbi:SLBB domain-containing protein [Geminocystis sp. NIES-3709]|uniref:SLBB domain-containing protein n=1 Tax=Geminocystis sp. NIES-3709 TaxID=1617448 RepID=UPI0005FC3992|nr:SLBB domain-containing protein [Geminocystis sp. NIES-3709]BAQ64530.1 putative polysaccharide export protein [Geminocystis sp. NIES-3709]
MKTKTILTLILNIPIVLFLSNQTLAQIPNSQQSESLYSANSSNILPTTKAYTLGSGDIINVSVYGLSDQGGEVKVLNDGTISLPLIGTFSIVNKTVQQVHQLLTTEYAKYIKRPVITVTLSAQRPLRLAIAGEVNTPGKYTLNPDLGERKNPKVTDLLEKAGGLTVSANVREIQLRRQETEGEKIYTLDFWQLLQKGDLKQDVDLQDGDVIVIPKQEKINPRESRQLADANFGIKYSQPPNVTIVGEVNRPGAYTIPIDNAPPRLTIALQQSGGIRDMANIQDITVNRITRDGQELNIKVNLLAMLETGDIGKDIVLQDGDTIIVPKAEELSATEAQTIASANFSPKEITVNVVGSVKNPGVLKITPNTSLNTAILASGGFDERRANDRVVQLVRINSNGTATKRDVSVNLSAGVNEESNPILKNNDVIMVGRNGMTEFSDTMGTILAPLGRTFPFLNIFSIFQ